MASNNFFSFQVISEKIAGKFFHGRIPTNLSTVHWYNCHISTSAKWVIPYLYIFAFYLLLSVWKMVLVWVHFLLKSLLSMSLLRHNGLLSKQKNEMVSVHQRLKATLEFFTTSLHIDMDKYQEQRATGIGKTHRYIHNFDLLVIVNFSVKQSHCQ